MNVDGLDDFHEKKMKQMNIPKWANIICPFCKKELPIRSIRSIGLKFNSRNIGDIFIEILCEHCEKMDTIYFREDVYDIADFISFLKNEKKPNNLPIIEEEMYKIKYNNLVEKMMINNIKDKNEY